MMRNTVLPRNTRLTKDGPSVGDLVADDRIGDCADIWLVRFGPVGGIRPESPRDLAGNPVGDTSCRSLGVDL